ncbi:bifunctional riboflavin kinase/FAD synthetase [Desulfurispirillum indicum]|uniref:Riboflavin biosynthesis protein n=1 Tax=Desulfurispirillum indicum (strain ATCC BAA-1389 / DSM 22839 / S5) TaxID=653733 RepID=E6W740_DESIS|nr:bifunctional riboflavin kinase/FAD synthetase [Desulfurispirillum indicum]ADU65118.1 riboflavin biosynthesis protein RibF [Desulfurispirillum indicum S5]UCZ57020.1 bifunctional riboflavin kinase/FAD synthetase [Desulfurispirillum indicum]
MEVYTSIDQVPPGRYQCPVLTIGNFDGVHLGHRRVFERLLASADETGSPALCLSFDPHPLKVLGRRDLKLLISREEKIQVIRSLGVNGLILHPFDMDFAALEPQRFVEQVLLEKLGIRKLVVGYDYAFGRNRAGDHHFFRHLRQQGLLDVEIVEPVSVDGTIVSSSLIRQLVQDGDMSAVARYLGRPYCLSGTVVEGDMRGKKIGFPTANLAYIQEILPPTGVYATVARVGNKSFVALTNIGYNPTFVERRVVSVETHILDFSRNLYGFPLELLFLERIRGEVKFASAQDLIAQIHKDIEHTRQRIDSHKHP